MATGRLDALQERILALLAGMEPPWTLSGGGALCGIHLGHRTTKDLDLFWHGTPRLDSQAGEAERRLRDAGLEVAVLERHPAFVRLRARDGADVVVLDLVAEPVSFVEAPTSVDLNGTVIRVDTRHEILVNKLCALLGRSEIRDLVDIRALLETGGDLARALRDAPFKDGGFSPLVLAWLLRELDVVRLAESEGMKGDEARDLAGYRDRLVERLTALAMPE